VKQAFKIPSPNPNPRGRKRGGEEERERGSKGRRELVDQEKRERKGVRGF